MTRKTYRRYWARMQGRFVSTMLLVAATPALLWSQTERRAMQLLRAPASSRAANAELDSDDPRVLRSRRVNIDFTALGSAATRTVLSAERVRTLELDLFDDASIRFVVERDEANETGGRSMSGHAEGAEESHVNLVAGNGVLVGDVIVDGRTFHIRYDGSEHVVREVDADQYPPEADPVPVFGNVTAADVAGAAADSGEFFDLMVVYTAVARSAAGGTNAMVNRIQMGVTDTNLAFQRSGIAPRVRLVHTAEVSYAESADMGDDLTRLARTSDGFMDAVHSLRDQYGADLVKLIVGSSTIYCGIAYVMCADDPGFESSAFSVTALGCMTAPAYTFTHEIGHNVSANHAAGDPISCSAFSYSRGYKDFIGNFRTVMGYGPPWPRILNFANPSVSHDGRPTGTAVANNASSINNLSTTISNFRSQVGTPEITSPPPGSDLAGSSVTFQWDDHGSTSSDWWLNIGSSPGASNYYDSGSLGATTSHIASGLPTDGRALHVRLWYFFAGDWRSVDFEYTAANSGMLPPTVTSPTPGTTLSGSATTFVWTGQSFPVTEWWLFVGSSPGGSDILDSGGLGTNLSHTVTGIPTDGRTVHLRLWYLSYGAWQSVDFQYTADTVAGSAPEVVSPAPGSTLSGSSASFGWTSNGSQVDEWWLYVGSSPGGSDVHDSGSLGGSLSDTVTGIPTDGRTIHVRLWYRSGAVWLSIDTQYTADTAGTPAGNTPAITSPAPGGTLSGASSSFTWTANGSQVDEWWLYVGSTEGGLDIHDSGSLGTNLSHAVTGLPTDGRTIHVRLWYRSQGVWQGTDFQFTADTLVASAPVITSPAPGGTLSGSSASFNWTANGSPVDEWWLYVGSTSGGFDIHDSGSLGSSLSHTVTGIPTDGRQIHVQLWYRVGATWSSNRFQYTAAP